MKHRARACPTRAGAFFLLEAGRMWRRRPRLRGAGGGLPPVAQPKAAVPHTEPRRAANGPTCGLSPASRVIRPAPPGNYPRYRLLHAEGVVGGGEGEHGRGPQARAIIEHGLYWISVGDVTESRFLTAVLTSEVVRDRAAHLQATGQWGARHFDKVMFELPIPEFSATVPLHSALAGAAERAEAVAAAVPPREKEYFTRTRGRIRDALREDGLAQEIDRLVEELLS